LRTTPRLYQKIAAEEIETFKGGKRRFARNAEIINVKTARRSPVRFPEAYRAESVPGMDTLSGYSRQQDEQHGEFTARLRSAAI
jgi:hypothetical protein